MEASPLGRARLRCADADRHAVIELLREAAGDGRIDLDELDERVGRAHHARTYADLDDLVADLPVGAPVLRPQVHPPGTTGDVLVLRSSVSDRVQAGAWRVPSRIVAETGMGKVRIDFVDATCTHAVVDVEVRVRAGTVVLVVPEGWSVRTDAVTTRVGSVRNRVGDRGTTPLLRVTGSCSVGDLVVRLPWPTWRFPGMPR